MTVSVTYNCPLNVNLSFNYTLRDCFPISPSKLVNHTAILQLIQVWLDQAKVHNMSLSSWEPPMEQSVYFHLSFFSLNLNMHCQMLQDFEQINTLLKKNKSEFQLIIKYPILSQMDIQKLWEKVSIKPWKGTDHSLAKVLLIHNQFILIKTTGVTG